MQVHSIGSSLRPRARELLGCASWAGEITPVLNRPYLVKGVIARGELSLVYGASNVGKSFFVIDLAQGVQSGRQWFGRRVRAASVLYVLCEGGGGFANRAYAVGATFWMLQAGVTLAGQRSDAVPLVETVRHLSQLHGAFGLIVIDTLARAMGDRDENAAADIADMLRNADLIRAATGAHVMLVHHSGKDATRGARGHSALRAAIDTEIALSRDEDSGIITATVAKQRDGATGAAFRFKLRRVTLGVDDDGDEVTTCTVAPLRDEATPSHHRAPSEAEAVALAALDTLATRGAVTAGGAFRLPKISGNVPRRGHGRGLARRRDCGGRVQVGGSLSPARDVQQGSRRAGGGGPDRVRGR